MSNVLLTRKIHSTNHDYVFIPPHSLRKTYLCRGEIENLGWEFVPNTHYLLEFHDRQVKGAVKVFRDCEKYIRDFNVDVWVGRRKLFVDAYKSFCDDVETACWDNGNKPVWILPFEIDENYEIEGEER